MEVEGAPGGGEGSFCADRCSTGAEFRRRDRRRRWPVNGSMRQAFLLDAVALGDRSVALRALGLDAIQVAFNVGRSNDQARRGAMDGGQRFLARMRSQSRLHKHVALRVR